MNSTVVDFRGGGGGGGSYLFRGRQAAYKGRIVNTGRPLFFNIAISQPVFGWKNPQPGKVSHPNQWYDEEGGNDNGLLFKTKLEGAR